jgi:hypothetical protein
MKYELWNAASGNRLGSFEGLGELAAVVREFAELNGENAIADLFAEGWLPNAVAPNDSLDAASLRRLALPLVRLIVVPNEPETTSTAARPLVWRPA